MVGSITAQDNTKIGTFRFAWTDTSCDVHSRQCIRRTSVVAIPIVFFWTDCCVVIADDQIGAAYSNTGLMYIT